MADYQLPVAVLVFFLALFGILGAVGLPRVRFARPLSILAWPPKIQRVESYPASITYRGPPGIHYVIKKRVFVGQAALPRWAYLGDSRIVSANITSKLVSQSENGLLKLNALVKDNTTEYPILVFSEDTATKYLDRSFFEGELRNLHSAWRDALIELVYPEDPMTKGLDSAVLRDAPHDPAPIARRSIFIEAELISGGIEVSEPKLLSMELSTAGITFQWALAFNNSGVHELQIIMRAISGENGREKKFELYRSPIHEVRVFKLDGLTQRQFFLGSLIAGVSSLLWILTQFALRIQEAM